MARMKRTVKDTVFTCMFRKDRYRLALYRALHPQDVGVTEEDLKLVTLEHVFADGIYNDLAFLVRDVVIIMVGAQSTFSVNIALRILLYLKETYKEYVTEHNMSLHAVTPLKLPVPELFVVYTGEKQDVPSVISLSELYGKNTLGISGSVELTVRVLQSDGSGSIIDQYVRFCKIADEQREKYGRTKEALQETFRICLEKGILSEFLMEHKKEVIDIMVKLFDQEKIDEERENRLREQALEKGRKEGRKEGREEGREEMFGQVIAMLKRTAQKKDSVIHTLIRDFNCSPEAAEEKVNQYWETVSA